jgi:tetratricopeptide (TPR) repeat protein
MAREICERTNSQAVLHGFIARSGQHYLLTEEASNCVDGGVIAEAKHEATQADDLPHSIDVLAESLRQRLGESRSSIRRFNTPLFQGDNTVSLDALKAYTQGSEALRLGDISDAISLLKTSVAADPNFAAGWYGLYAAYASAGDDVDARAAVTQAYRLKDTASRLMQFHINSAFIQTNTQDLYESLRNVEAWAALYPNSYVALNTLSNVQRDLARYSDAVRSSQRAMAISPENAAINIDLITGQIQSGDLSAARSGCDQAVIKHLDGDGLRIRCLELAYVLHEPGFMEAQKAWYAAHPEAPTFTLGLTRIAISEGRFNDARRLAAKTSELFHEQGVGGAGDHFKKSLAVEMMESGDVEAGERLFRSTPIDPEEGQDLLGLVYEGDVAGAKSALHAMQSKYPKGTLWNLYYGPQIRAAVAMAERNPAQAAAILEEARPIEMRELVVPWMRGVAHLGAVKPALAEKEFRQVVTHPEVDPTSCEIPLSWLGLGRALAAQGNRPAARDAYQHFLALWAHADPDAKFLVEARNELKALQASEPVHGSLGKPEGSR